MAVIRTGSWSWNAVEKIEPLVAGQIDAPSWRKNVSVLVAPGHAAIDDSSRARRAIDTWLIRGGERITP